ncbi:DUF5591 domain-containing protein [Caldiplasma sukawensis]
MILKDDASYNLPLIITPESVKSTFNSFEILEEKCFLREVQLSSGKIQLYESDHFIIPKIDPSFIIKSRRFVRTLLELKINIGYSKLLYVPGISDPYLLPVEFLMGVDCFDTLMSDYESALGIEYSMFGRINRKEKLNIETNRNFLKKEIDLLSNSISTGKLIEIVEKWSISNRSVEALRIIENEYGHIYEKFFPRRTNSILSTDLISLGRPDIVRYRKFISEDYRKPKDLKICLFIPCSAKKPYSSSKTHKALIQSLGNRRYHIHEVILTSPVGVVPRDLEETYPAGFYDIPVTGQWFMDEMNMLENLISKYLENNKYDEIVFFVDDSLLFLEKKFGKNGKFIKWDKKDSESFNVLNNYLDSIIKEGHKVRKRNFLQEKLISTAKYQFGEWILKYIENLELKKMFNQFMLVEKNNPYFIYREDMGKLTINKNASNIFIKENKFIVEIDDFYPTANIYSVGIKNCTEDIRQEDEVVITHNGEARGVGVAKMPSLAMMTTEKGVAVKMRN